MPVHPGQDQYGMFFQWGGLKKYYYDPNNEDSKRAAFEAATRQGRAVYSSGWRKKT